MKKHLLSFAFLLCASATMAQWVDDPSQNTLLATGSSDYGEIYISTNPQSGDTYIQWNNMKSNGWVPSLQKVDVNGVPQWGDDGILISGQQCATWSNGVAMTHLKDGGAVSAFANADGQCIAVKLNEDGSFAWGEAGIVALEMSDCLRVELAAGNDGGFWIMGYDYSNTYLRYYNSDGTPYGQQVTISDSNGKSVDFTQLVLDDDNNVFAVYIKEQWAVSYYYNKSICVAKYTPEGVQATPEVELMTEFSMSGQIYHYALADGLGGGYAYISHPAINDCFEVYAFHFDSNGNNTFSQHEGLTVSAPDGYNFHFQPNASVDPVSHDLLVAYRQTDADYQIHDAILVNRITADGEKVWGDAGFTLIPTAEQSLSSIMIDAFPDGSGASIVYEYSNSGYNYTIHSIGISNDGSRLWTSDICTSPSYVSLCDFTSGYHNGQTIIAWQDGRDGNTALYGQNLQPDGSLGPVEQGTCYPPVNLEGSYFWNDEGYSFGALVSWETPETTPLSYNLYRDNYVISVPANETSYIDPVPVGTYTYRLTAVYEDCESDFALTADGNDFVVVEVTSVDENDESQVVVYQNRNYLHVVCDNIEQVSVFSATGQLIKTELCNANMVDIDVNDLQSGIYVVRVAAKGVVTNKKIIIK